jgi:hypothetical protein
MARSDLSEELITAGRRLVAATDGLGLQAQGAMWLYSYVLDDWRFYLVTSLVDTLGRRRTYRMLLDAFEAVELPQSLTVEDVHLGSPTDPFFGLVAGAVSVTGDSVARFVDCRFNGVPFDGVVYRITREPPSEKEAQKIEKRFTKRVRDAVDAHAKALHTR